MKIFIEEYKGQSIYYNEDADKFVCDIELNNNVKSSKRGSLKDLKKEIDLFVKENLNFKPFQFFKVQFGDFTEMTCENIRNDGKFVVKSSYRTEYYDKKDFKSAFEFDFDKKYQVALIDAEFELQRKEYQRKKDEIISQLKPLDISKYDIAGTN